MVISPDYRHVPIGALTVLAQRPRQGLSLALHLIPPRPAERLAPTPLRGHPAKTQDGLRTTRAYEMWHIDTAVIRLLDGTRAISMAVIDNFSRRILACRVADTFAPDP